MTKPRIKRFLACGNSGVLVEFAGHSEGEASVASGASVAQCLGKAMRNASIKGITDATPGLASLLVHYDPLLTSFEAVKAAVVESYDPLDLTDEVGARQWIIPVCYGADYGADLAAVAKAKGLTRDEVIAEHTGHILTIAIMGFLPGLAYMKGVSKRLEMPRRSNPRPNVPARSVGIAMDQTVIYPLASPGGWNLIGRTPVRPFNPDIEPPILFQPDDKIRFEAIDKKRFIELEKAYEADEITAPELDKPA